MAIIRQTRPLAINAKGNSKSIECITLRIGCIRPLMTLLWLNKEVPNEAASKPITIKTGIKRSISIASVLNITMDVISKRMGTDYKDKSTP